MLQNKTNFAKLQIMQIFFFFFFFCQEINKHVIFLKRKWTLIQLFQGSGFKGSKVC